MHCGGKTGEIRVFGKAVCTRTTAPSFRIAQIEHRRNSQGKNSHNVVYMMEENVIKISVLYLQHLWVW